MNLTYIYINNKSNIYIYIYKHCQLHTRSYATISCQLIACIGLWVNLHSCCFWVFIVYKGILLSPDWSCCIAYCAIATYIATVVRNCLIHASAKATATAVGNRAAHKGAWGREREAARGEGEKGRVGIQTETKRQDRQMLNSALEY